jgi:hypothetical protein
MVQRMNQAARVVVVNPNQMTLKTGEGDTRTGRRKRGKIKRPRR